MNNKVEPPAMAYARDRGPKDVEDVAVQAGVKEIEAIAIVWTKTARIVAYVLIWIVYFAMLMQQNASASLTPYVTSSFLLHSLTPTVTILSSVIGGVCNLTIAKILDVFGRPHGYGLALVLTTMGLIMMAATNSVEMYAAAQVFWTVGNNALLYTVGIFIADTTALHNRALMTALASSPTLATIWLGGPIAEGFLDGPGWKWCYGFFCILIPVLCLPLFGLLVWNSHKARKEGVFVIEKSSRTLLQTFAYYCREFDIIGLLLLTAGLALFLLPFNLYTLQADGWRSLLIICLLVFGVVLIILFTLWERFFAPVNFMPYSLLLDRNMVGACLLGAVLFVSYYCWFSMFASYLQVVNDLSITKASYVANTYSVGGTVAAICTGIFIRYTGRYKAPTLYIAIPVYILFMGLMIHFRDSDQDVGYMIMCLVFLSISGGILSSTPQIAAMSSASHQHIAAVVAVLSMFSSIGSAIGATVSGAIWQDIFPTKLAEYLPAEEQANLLTIYGSIDVQVGYPVGSPGRIAIQRAYADAQEMMLTAGTAIWVLGVVGVAIWRNTDVRTLRGNVV
ncbi:major facilitator superfamily-domain-containing protein [Aspergillus tamarii]|uniref:Major facilitator superfamily-domain-containing protein n=1 Tax=Aspergillus tamarii TaxID=41984 RepID=A0A5N6VCG7_ASPTM|nr:major facilitator superfamily-domain-containing protein [Aspergillus tamarii]